MPGFLYFPLTMTVPICSQEHPIFLSAIIEADSQSSEFSVSLPFFPLLEHKQANATGLITMATTRTVMMSVFVF